MDVTLPGARGPVPVELVVAIGLLAVSAVWVVIAALVDLKDLGDAFDFSGRLGFSFLLTILLGIALGASLALVGWMLLRGDRVGRVLLLVAAGAMLGAVIFAEDRPTSQIFATVFTIAAAVIVMVVPTVQRFFAQQPAPAVAPPGYPAAPAAYPGVPGPYPGAPVPAPISMQALRITLMVAAGWLGVLGVIYLLFPFLGARRILVVVVALALAAGAVVAMINLVRPDRTARLAAAAGGGAGAFLLLLMLLLVNFPGNDFSDGSDLEVPFVWMIPVMLVAAVPALLFLASDARAFFGDPPLDFGVARTTAPPPAQGYGQTQPQPYQAPPGQGYGQAPPAPGYPPQPHQAPPGQGYPPQPDYPPQTAQPYQPPPAPGYEATQAPTQFAPAPQMPPEEGASVPPSLRKEPAADTPGAPPTEVAAPAPAGPTEVSPVDPTQIGPVAPTPPVAAESCGTCGVARLPGTAFCVNCGTRFPDAAPPA